MLYYSAISASVLDQQNNYATMLCYFTTTLFPLWRGSWFEVAPTLNEANATWPSPVSTCGGVARNRTARNAALEVWAPRAAPASPRPRPPSLKLAIYCVFDQASPRSSAEVAGGNRLMAEPGRARAPRSHSWCKMAPIPPDDTASWPTPAYE